jgi:hypothetical protein
MGGITLYTFFAEQNIVHFEDLLKTDIGLGRRSMVLKLLLAEEQKLGDYSEEHLAALERHIADTNQRIARQRTIIAQLSANGNARAARSAELLLSALIDTQDLYHQHRARVQYGLLK